MITVTGIEVIVLNLIQNKHITIEQVVGNEEKVVNAIRAAEIECVKVFAKQYHEKETYTTNDCYHAFMKAVKEEMNK